MKRRISQGQAMRSIFGRSRVTQTLGFGGETSTPGPSPRHQRAAGLVEGLDAAFEHATSTPGAASSDAASALTLWPWTQ